MKIAVIMPVYRRVKTACNAVACFLSQILCVGCEARLFVIDDGDTFSDLGFATSYPHSVALWKTARRFSTLAAKYNAAKREILKDYNPDMIVLFDDDDVYLPWHLGVHAEALRGKSKAWSKPSRVLTDYWGDIREEDATGRFHGSIAFTADIESEWDESAGPDFDQKFMAALRAECGEPLDPLQIYPKPGYIFRWHTGHYHGQWWMNEPGNAWYERAEKHVPHPPQAVLSPQFDDFTLEILRSLSHEKSRQPAL